MDKTDERILDIMKDKARISFRELGEELGISRVAAMKRVRKLEDAGIIRQYNTCIYREDELTMFMDIETKPEKYDKVVKYITTRTAYIRQIFRTTGENRIHIVAVSDSVENLRYLAHMIQKKCGDDISFISAYVVKEVIKDVYGGVGNERKDRTDSQ
ncbi:MAG: Lrp/AsnC family transcriptional regulator [Lachnospiraceae bacterium]|nr:Lrp/AsnC family transcriptional regulator [Lachnospiraceae bacterium]